MSDEWEDWDADFSTPDAAASSMRELARYANPEQVRRLGIGLGMTRFAQRRDELGDAAKTILLAEQLVRKRLHYTIEPFNPRRRLGLSRAWRQMIRWTPELLEGSGTCLDFAISLTAAAISENIPAILAVAVPDEAPTPCHAFVIVQERSGPGGGGVAYTASSFRDWAAAFDRTDLATRHYLIDLTPLPGMGDDLATLGRHTIDWLAGRDGTVHAIDVMAALDYVAKLGATKSPWRPPPDASRYHGLTGWLPDPPVDLVDYPSRTELLRDLENVTGTVVLSGSRGTGKSTLALLRAGAQSGGRGWFLDGSDKNTLLRSYAAAEAQCRGRVLENDQGEHIGTFAGFARRRLAQTDRPWVVVIDNADDPEQIVDLLPTPGDGQLVIVTTTNHDWAAGRTGAGWTTYHLEPLAVDDLDEPTHRLGLDDGELLPGLIRVARGCDPEVLRANLASTPGADRLVRAALGGRPGETLSLDASTATLTVVAAAFMPAEQITVGWLADAVLAGDQAAARDAARSIEGRGLFEYSRYTSGIREHDEMPVWMHRQLRAAVHRIVGEAGNEVGLRVLAEHYGRKRPQRYSAGEMAELVEFLASLPAGSHPPLFPPAATAVMDQLEPRGSAQVENAARLARLVLPYVESSASGGPDIYCCALMAMAREVNQATHPPRNDIDRAIEWCLTASKCCSGDDLDSELLRGRADAMRGVMVKKKATSFKKEQPELALALYNESLEILQQSYETRRQAMTVSTDGGTKLLPDPQRHVDRGWYNIGGACVGLANLLMDRDPAQAAEVLSRGLRAYAGSLSLRRDSQSKYTAASLWGTALVLYTAALHCPGELSLDHVVAEEELAAVRRDPNERTMLYAAESCVMEAIQIWTLIDGPAGSDTVKGRNLLRKICLAWLVVGLPRDKRWSALRARLRPFLEDIGLDWPE